MSSSPPSSDPFDRHSGLHDAWAVTRAQSEMATQIMRDGEDDEAAARDIGRAVGPNQRELFVSCAAAEALQQQFEHLQPDFIAIHDIATATSRRLISGISSASGRPLQKLSIRRQSYGTALATIEYVDVPAADGSTLRLYSTTVDADTASRHAVARALLAYSRLGVVMIGELPSHGLESALNGLRDDMLAGDWQNRHLLLLPLANASAVAAHAAALSQGTPVEVRSTPQVTRPAEAWNFINGSWARVRGAAAPRPASPRTAAPAPGPVAADGFAETAVMPRPAPVPATPPPALAMRPMPEVPRQKSPPAAPVDVFGRYVQKVAELAGVISCCVFELGPGRPLAHAGASPGADELALHGSELASSIAGTCRALGLGHAIPDAAITLGAHHLLLRPLPRHPGLALHAVLDKNHANLTLARLQIGRLDAIFDEAAPPA